MRKKRIEYGIEGDDIFVGCTWPDLYLRDPAYSLLRPLYDITSPWRSDPEHLSLYLNSQARRLGGRKYLLFYFSVLRLLVTEYSYPSFFSFLTNPFNVDGLNLKLLFSEMIDFLHWRFWNFKPWDGLDIDELSNDGNTIVHLNLLPERKKKKLFKLENDLSSDLITKAIKECSSLGKNSNEDLITQMFVPTSSYNISIKNGYTVLEDVSVILSEYYITKELETIWQFKRILGCYARWDSAKVVIFTSEVKDIKGMFDTIREVYSYACIGDIKQLDTDYFISLLIPTDISSKLSFVVSEWQLNSQLHVEEIE